MGRKMMKNYFLKLTLLKCFICSCFIWSSLFFHEVLCESDVDKDAPFIIKGFAGEQVSLPCLFEIPTGDRVSVILWYRENNPEAIFTHDARKKFSGFQQRGPLEGRTSFHKLPSPHLLIKNVSQEDAGYYDCRADFYKATSHTTHLKVTIITLPTKIVIQNETGDNVGDSLSRTVGDRLVATCLVFGGIPVPSVWWLLDGKRIKGSLESIDKSVATSQIQLLLNKRNFHQSNLRCIASNTNSTVSVNKTVQILLNTPPSSLHIGGLPEILHVGRTYNPFCKIEGSRPASIATWTIVTEYGKTVVNKSVDLRALNQTVARFGLSVDSSLNGATLTCIATSPLLPHISVLNSSILNVYFVPIITLTLGQPLKMGSIREGIDVYFTCLIRANPPVKSTTWYHNEREIKNKPSEGILVTNDHLAIQRISRIWTGEFECQASNAIGVTTSLPLNIIVQYSPVCLRSPIAVMAALDQEVSIPCKVSAFPEKVSFVWDIINETGQPINLTVDKIKSKGQKSVLLFTPKRQEDFGTLECIATNIIGRQKSACVVHIKPYSSPYVPLHCTVSNQTWDSVEIWCNNHRNTNTINDQHVSNAAGGIMRYPSSTEQLAELTAKPTYFFTIRERLSNKTIYNKSAEILGRTQKLLFSGLTPGSDYVIVVSKINTPSWNERVLLEALTLRTAENISRNVESKESNLLAGWLVGLISILIIISIIIIISLRRRHCHRNDQLPTGNYSKYGFAHTAEEAKFPVQSNIESNLAYTDRGPITRACIGDNSYSEVQDSLLYERPSKEINKDPEASKEFSTVRQGIYQTTEKSNQSSHFSILGENSTNSFSYSLKESKQDEGSGTLSRINERQKPANNSYIVLKSENLAFSSRESFL